MTKITFISPDGKSTLITAESDTTLMEAAVNNDISGIDADCEGGCACATCHVLIPNEFAKIVTPLEEDEQYLLDFLDNRQRNSRLSCQIDITDKLDGMIVTVPEQN